MKKTLFTLSLLLAAGSAMAAEPTIELNGEVVDDSYYSSLSNRGNTVKVYDGEFKYVPSIEGGNDENVDGVVEQNEVIISNVKWLADVYGGVALNNMANNNSVTIENSGIGYITWVCGGYSRGNYGATGNTVTLRGNITFSASGETAVYGGKGGDNVVAGNTLILDNLNATGTLSTLKNFDALTFKVDTWENDATILTLTNAFTEYGDKGLTLTLDLTNCDLSAVNGNMTLLNSFGGNIEDITLNLIGVENEEKFTLSMQGTALVATYIIPEPTTVTLSLLALAGLAARRRRK